MGAWKEEGLPPDLRAVEDYGGLRLLKALFVFRISHGCPIEGVKFSAQTAGKALQISAILSTAAAAQHVPGPSGSP
jgi:hypothetical protein